MSRFPAVFPLVLSVALVPSMALAGTKAPAAKPAPAPVAAADIVAVLPFPGGTASGGPLTSTGDGDLVRSARTSSQSAVLASGHHLPSESEVQRAMTRLADGVADTRAEYKVVAADLHADWVVSAKIVPFSNGGHAGYRAELEAFQTKSGRIESLVREVDARVAEAQLGEMLKLLLRENGVGTESVVYTIQPPPDAPVVVPETPAVTVTPPKPELPRGPSIRPSEWDARVAYGSNRNFALGGGLGFTGALVRPSGARGSSFSTTFLATGGYRILPENHPGLEIRGDLGVGVAGQKAFHLSGGARYVFPIAADTFVGPEAQIGIFVPLGGDKSTRFLAKASGVLVQRLAPEVQLEGTLDLLAAPGGTGALVLGGGSVRGSFRF